MRNWTAFWMALGVMLTGGLIAWAVQRPPANSAEVAAWVQAIGSVGAIVAAVIVSNQSARRSRQIALEIQNREASARIEVAIHVANQARTLVSMAEARVTKSGPVALGPGDFDSVRGAIDALPIADLRSGRIVTSIMTLRRLLGPVQTLVEGYDSVKVALDEAGQKAFDAQMLVRTAAFNRTYEDLEAAVETALDCLSQAHASAPPG